MCTGAEAPGLQSTSARTFSETYLASARPSASGLAVGRTQPGLTPHRQAKIQLRDYIVPGVLARVVQLCLTLLYLRRRLLRCPLPKIQVCCASNNSRTAAGQGHSRLHGIISLGILNFHSRCYLDLM